MKIATIYYRSRPSEPGASETAMRLQRDAVRAAVEAGELKIVGEFVEQEDSGDESRPAYYAAMRAAQAHGSCLVIVSHAAIGSGEVFSEPCIEQDSRPLHVLLSIALIPAPSVIKAPPGTPGSLYLYAGFRPRQFDTLIYLCNGKTEPISRVTVALDSITMLEFYTMKSDQRWMTASNVSKQEWDLVPAGCAVLIDVLSHVSWDFVNRYRLTYSDVTGHRRTTVANSLALNAERLWADPTQVWSPFRAARETNPPAP